MCVLTIAQLEYQADGEADDTINMRLPDSNSWLRVVSCGHETYRFYHDREKGRPVEITRDEAIDLRNNEFLKWNKK